MADSTKFAGSGATTGDPAWTNLANITADDSAYASANVAVNSVSGSLIAYNFGFSLPEEATIDGVEVTINAKSSGSWITTLLGNGAGFQLGSWDGDTFTANGNLKTNSTYWRTFDKDYTLGSSSDTWGATLSPSTINNSNFAVKIIVHGFTVAQTASIDAVKITVYYTTPPSIAKIMGVAKTDIIKVNGVSMSSISKIIGITP